MVSAICGVLILAIIFALIRDPSFRKDISASQGKASIFNVISVQGALVLILCSLFFYGFIHPVAYPQASFKKIDELTKELTLKSAEVKKLNSYVGRIKIEQIPQFIKSLSPSNAISKHIYSFPSRELGPWSKFSESKLISISVPGHKITAGSALSCQELYGRQYDLFSAIEKGGQKITGEAVTVKADGYIYRSSDCHKKVSYQLQVSCADALRIFTDAVLSCDKSGQPKWMNQKPEKLMVNLVASEANAHVSKEEKEGSIMANWFK